MKNLQLKQDLSSEAWFSGASVSFSVPRATAYGGVLIDAGDRVLLREPTNHHGDYVWTFPKGRPDAGESPMEVALREVKEETGYDARVIGALPKAFRGTLTTTSFFLMRPIGAQGEFTRAETARTTWVSFDEARLLIAQTRTPEGRARDLAVLEMAQAVYLQIAAI